MRIWEKVTEEETEFKSLLKEIYSILYILKFKAVNYKFPIGDINTKPRSYSFQSYSSQMILPILEDVQFEQFVSLQSDRPEIFHECAARNIIPE